MIESNFISAKYKKKSYLTWIFFLQKLFEVILLIETFFY